MKSQSKFPFEASCMGDPEWWPTWLLLPDSSGVYIIFSHQHCHIAKKSMYPFWGHFKTICPRISASSWNFGAIWFCSLKSFHTGSLWFGFLRKEICSYPDQSWSVTWLLAWAAPSWLSSRPPAVFAGIPNLKSYFENYASGGLDGGLAIMAPCLRPLPATIFLFGWMR